MHEPMSDGTGGVCMRCVVISWPSFTSVFYNVSSVSTHYEFSLQNFLCV